MKRIRHILPGFGYFPDEPEHAPISGIVAAAYQLARASVDRGFLTSLVSFSNGADQRVFQVDGIRVHRLKPRRVLAFQRADLSYAAPLAIFGMRSRVDLAHVHSNPYLLAALRTRYRVLHYHTPDFSNLPAYRRAVMRADGVIFCSQALREQFIATVGEIPRPLDVVPNSVDVGRFQGNELAGERFRERFGIAPQEFVILYAGQLSKVKGAHVLLEAVRAARVDVDRPIRLVIAGSSMLWQKAGVVPVQSAFERELRDNADPSFITFVGALPQHEMPTAYAACDLFVLPSIWTEPFGITLLEAMAAGKPVIASRTGGIPEVVIDGETGNLVEPDDVSALAKAIAECVRDPLRLQAMGQAATRHAKTFEWQHVTKSVFDIYDRISEFQIAECVNRPDQDA